MNSQQAREILLRYRPGTSDDRDPEVTDALDLAGRDPDLGAWLAEHRALQQAVQQRFRDLTVPEGLREQILSEKRVRLAPWRSPRVLGLATLATVLIALGIVYWTSTQADPERRFATFRMRMVETALRGYAMDIETDDAAEIRSYLAAQRAPSDWESPRALEAMPLLGCAVLTWQGQPAAMICYGAGLPPQRWLFVVDSTSLPDPPGEEQVVEKVNRLNTVSWTLEGRTYILAGEAEEGELMRSLGGRT